MNPSSGHPPLRTNAQRTGKIAGFLRRVSRKLLNLIQPALPQRVYMRLFIHWLRQRGVRVSGAPIYIAPTVFFDGTDLSLIVIGDKAVISSHVSLLTHDFSLARVRDAIEQRTIFPEVAIVRPIVIGDNCFIGRSSILMPGTELGANCLVGAGSVVRGKFPANSIIVGNPASVVGDSLKWGRTKLERAGLL